MERKSQSVKANAPLCVFLGVTLAIFVKVFALDVYRVSGFSMEGAVGNGRLVLVNKLSYGLQNPFKPELLFSWKEPKKGDVVIYMYQNSWVIKRCAATGGTPLFCEDADDKAFLFVEGERIPLTQIQFHRMKASLAVPNNYVLCIGDNYEKSIDSRTYGFVPKKNIVARAML